jgi:Pentapeptide repeats (8 copies)
VGPFIILSRPVKEKALEFLTVHYFQSDAYPGDNLRLTGPNLNKANLSGANLKHGEIAAANLRDADLSHADLTEADAAYARGSGGSRC